MPGPAKHPKGPGAAVRLSLSLLPLLPGAAALFLGHWYVTAFACAVLSLYLLHRNAPVAVRAWMEKPAGIRWWTLVPGIAAGWFGAWELGRPEPEWLPGLPLQLLSFFLILASFPVRAILEGRGPDPAPVRRSATTPKDDPWSTGLILFLALVAVALLNTRRWEDLGSFLAVGAVILAGMVRERTVPGPDRIPGGEWPALAGILTVAALMRFPFLGRYFTGFQLDEANHMLDAILLNKGELATPLMTGWWGNPTLPYAFTGEVFKILGVSLAAARGFSVVVSLLAAFLFYRLGRRFLGAPAALLATLLLNLSWWNLYYSLSPFTNIFTLLSEVAAFLVILRALENGRRADHWWGGVLAAVSVMTYISGRLVPLMLGTAVLLMALLEGRAFLKAQGRHLFLSALGFFWALGPFLFHIFRNMEEHFLGRSRELSIFNEVARTGDWAMPLKHLFYTGLALVWPGAFTDDRFALPGTAYLDPLTAVLFLLGLGVTLGTVRKRASLLLLSGLLFGLLANALAIQSQAPNPKYINAQRLFLVLPFVCLLAGRGFQWAWSRSGLARGIHRSLFLAALGLLILGAGWINGKRFYHDLSHHPNCWVSMGYYRLVADRIYEEHKDDARILASWSLHNTVGEFLSRGRHQVEQFTVLEPPFPGPFEKDILVVTEDWSWKREKETLRRTYPGAVEEKITDPWGNPRLDVLRIPKAELIRAAGGRGGG